ncbi:MAG: chlorite dismutase family protein [Planctomycetota bacterium]|nr:chlorite dismutase family protein [Planctomycetota bacterium]
MERPAAPPRPDITEKGAPKDGQPQSSDRRLFMQLLAFEGAGDAAPIAAWLDQSGIEGALYEDVNHPTGVAMLTFSEDPGFFVGPLRAKLRQGPFHALRLRPEFTMFGRTYSLGYEPDLEETLFRRPRRTALNPAWPWAIWYPLRRSGRFTQLPPEEQRAILSEHGTIGRAFGEANFAHDIRLACHGLDTHDNDFVVGLTGPEIHPLSAIVQTMRKTQQTALYLEKLGPFLVGKTAWKSRAV